MISALNCGSKPLDLNTPRVMGILNVTPDSFADGGRFSTIDTALEQARQMVAEGAAIIDVGGESTRPGAQPVSVDSELERVIPVIEAIVAEIDVPISIDTSKPEVASAAIAAGAGMINDVAALRAPNMLATAAKLGVPVVLMHMQGEPRTMQSEPHYEDVVAEVGQFLQQRIDAAVAAGIARETILIDPGFGFGKTLTHNLTLLRELPQLVALGQLLLVGVSRKSMIGSVLNRPVAERLIGSVALAGLAIWQGATILRVHDVAATVDVVKMVTAVKSGQLEQ